MHQGVRRKPPFQTFLGKDLCPSLPFPRLPIFSEKRIRLGEHDGLY